MCVNCLKRGCALHLKNLLNNCLPQTPFNEMVEHATQYERRQEAEKGEKKAIKRKGDEIDSLVDQDDDDQKLKLKIAKFELETKQKQEIKNDLSNTIRQLKDQMNGKFDKMNETINSLTQFKWRRVDFPFSKDLS